MDHPFHPRTEDVIDQGIGSYKKGLCHCTTKEDSVSSGIEFILVDSFRKGSVGKISLYGQ